MDRSKIKTADEAVPYSIDAERSVLGSMIISKNAVEVATELSICNSRNFDYSCAGTAVAMEKDANTRMNFFSRLSSFKKNCSGVDNMSREERLKCYTTMADESFDEEEGK